MAGKVIQIDNVNGDDDRFRALCDDGTIWDVRLLSQFDDEPQWKWCRIPDIQHDDGVR